MVDDRVPADVHAVLAAEQVVDSGEAAFGDGVEVPAIGGAAGDREDVAHLLLAAAEPVALPVEPLADGGDDALGCPFAGRLVACLPFGGIALHPLDHPAVCRRVFAVQFAERIRFAPAGLADEARFDDFLVRLVVALGLLQERPEEGVRRFLFCLVHICSIKN